MKRAIGLLLLLVIAAPSPLKAVDAFPSSAVGFLETSDRRTDWWGKNYPRSSAPITTDCWINQPDSGYQAPCRKVFATGQVIVGEERSLMNIGNAAYARKYARIRTSLFVTPVPMVPQFLAPHPYVNPPRAIQDGKQLPLPIEELTDVIRRSTLSDITISFPENMTEMPVALYRDMALMSMHEIFQYQWGWNISYEETRLHPALEAGWEYWQRAADAHPMACFAKPMEGSPTMTAECTTAIVVTATGRSLEPAGFSRGIAVCATDKKRTFYYNCSLVTMLTKDGKRYVKAIVGPAHPMGGGAFANNAGMFTLTCDFPQDNMRQKLLEIRDSLNLGGTYKVDKAVDIRSSTGFRYFSAAHKWGEVMMFVHVYEYDTSENRVSITFIGRWGNQNVNDNKIPLFEDTDVETFKAAVFEPMIGGKNRCRKESASMPNIAQR